MTKKALIVDDSRLACRVLAKMLDGFNITSDEAYSAENALVYLNKKQPDVIFLDHIMPGMNGLEMMKILKNNPTTATIPVMMYTSKEGGVYFGQARSLGAIDVLPKGLEETHLRKALEKIGLLNHSEETAINQNQPAQKNKAVAPLLDTHSPELAKPPVPTAVTRAPQLPTKPPQPDWKEFWHQTVEPYLAKKKDQHQQEQQYNTKLQTRKLTRELHSTLEQFEHALVLRLESHADFVASTQAASKSVRRKSYLTLATLILALQIGIFWQLWNSNQLSHSLKLAQLENNTQQESINQQLTNLSSEVNQLAISSNTQHNGAKQTYLPGVVLFQQNQMIAELLLIDANNGIFRGTTSNGYVFMVNAQGQFVKNIEDRYFLTENCIGDVFVKSPAGVILKGESEQLWYVDRLADEVVMNVNSILTAKDQCTILSNEELSLNRLQQNVYFETGIDDYQPVRIVFE
jgi:CheY-like chemotaxis protein